MKTAVNKLIIITLFAIAMGFLESAVVIYLREIMYPEGFNFPLAPIHPDLALTEILREAATMIMLICIGLLAARTFSERFAWFIYSFAIWDIFYYIFLWLLVDWPESLMTWDVLFLIPATWTGPVVTPLILTLLMISLSLTIIFAGSRGKNTRIQALEWTAMSFGSVIVILAFISDYMNHMLAAFSFSELLRFGDPRLLEIARQYVPDKFPWVFFLIGIGIIFLSIVRFCIRIFRKN